MLKIVKKIKDAVIRKRHPFIDRLLEDGLTYMQPNDLIELEETITTLRKKNLEGIYLEAGVALGGSALFICKYKNPSTPLFLYDVYDMIPEPSGKDDSDVHKRYAEIKEGNSKGINGNRYYGYEKDLLTKVKDNFTNYDLDPSKNNVSFLVGKFQDTMTIKEKVAFAHLDCDWYESVKYCLEEIHPHLVAGGQFLIDDYFHYSGCRKAVDEFLKAHPNEYKKIEKSKLHLIKQ